MFCHNCGKEISEGAVFCAGCGIKIAKPNTLEKKKTLLKKLFTKAENVATKPIGRVEKQRKRKKWVIGIGLAALLCILICVFVPKAMVKIGRYQQSQRHYSNAVHWYTTAAKMGNADAQYWLGNCYYYGHAVSENHTEAFYWWRLAAKQGHYLAQSSLSAKGESW